jgi:hypothetical protein
VRRAGSVRIPFLLVVPEADAIAPVPAALDVTRRAPGAELFRSGGGQYDVSRSVLQRARADYRCEATMGTERWLAITMPRSGDTCALTTRSRSSSVVSEKSGRALTHE